MKIKDYIKIQ